MRPWLAIAVVILLVFSAGCIGGSDSSSLLPDATKTLKTPVTKTPSKTATPRTTRVTPTPTIRTGPVPDPLPLANDYGKAEVTITRSQFLTADAEGLPADERTYLVLNVRVKDTGIPGGPTHPDGQPFLWSDNLEVFDADANHYTARNAFTEFYFRDPLEPRAAMEIGEVKEGVRIYLVPDSTRNYTLYLTNRRKASYGMDPEKWPDTDKGTGIVAKALVPAPEPMSSSDPVLAPVRSADYGKVGLTVRNAWIVDQYEANYFTPPQEPVWNTVKAPRTMEYVVVECDLANSGIGSQREHQGFALYGYSFGLLDEYGLNNARPSNTEFYQPDGDSTLRQGETRTFTLVFLVPKGVGTQYRLFVHDTRGNPTMRDDEVDNPPHSIAEAVFTPQLDDTVRIRV